ncbi:hypothetical protein ES705_15220 [subsurface metagenome]
MKEETIKIKLLLFLTLFFKRCYKKLDKMYVKELGNFNIRFITSSQ